MEITDEPLGYFITWTVYGTFLQADFGATSAGGGKSEKVASRRNLD